MAAAKVGDPPKVLFFLYFLILAPGLPRSDGTTDPGDAAAMAALAKSITPLPKQWSTDPTLDPCGQRWAGVSCNSGRVVSINLQATSLNGELSPAITNLSSLQSLSLQRNLLRGALPSLNGLFNLRELYLGNNAFTSIPTDFFKGLTSLVNVSLDHNPLSPWSLPSDLSLSTNIAYFSAMNASVTGQIPNYFDSLVTLQSFRLSYNHLSGGLPVSFGSTSIRELYLNNQVLSDSTTTGKLSGPLDVLGSMGQLTVAWVHDNAFTGPIPDLSKTSLVDLQLRDNQLTGLVPVSLFSLASLRNLTLSNNLLQGPFPSPSPGSNVLVDATPGNSFCNSKPGPCDGRVTELLSVAEGFGYPASLANAWQGNNPCNGWLFVTCDAQGNITTLSFGGQSLVGTISDSFANFTALKVLKLQNNNLTGPIPKSLTGLTQLQLLDVGNNNLTGAVPNFKSSVKLIVSGNPLLGTNSGSGNSGDAGSNSGSGGSSSSNGSTSGSSRSLSTGIVVLIVFLAAAVAVGMGALLYRKRKNRRERLGKVEISHSHSPPGGPEMVKLDIAALRSNGVAGGGIKSQGSGDHGTSHLVEGQGMCIPIQELRQATDNFSEANILGSGGFGVVYKGEMPDGTLIAVKRTECTTMDMKGISEFKAEIEVLRKVRHRHLVALLGYCEHDNEKLLVYEYMPQGTLGQHLFHGHEGVYPPLTWKQRLTVALDVARGLEYLHSLAQTSFIHRDLKPSNVLLDNDMRAKVSDFGLVKLAPDGKNSMQTRLAGTFGYLAPEYATTGRVTTKVDVYAFGVVLMELITGRKALDESIPDENTHLVSWFRRVLINKENIRKSVDARLDLSEEDFDSISVVAELAGHCTSREAHQRPDMGHAVNVLAPLVDQWKPSSSNEEDGDSLGFPETLSQRVQRWQLNEGTSMTGFNFNSHYRSLENTQGSIPVNPETYPDAR